MQPYMLEEFPPEISRLQPLFFSSDFGDQGKYLLSLYRSFYLCLCIAHDIIPLWPDLPYPVHDELPALSPKKYNITFLKLSVRPFEIYHISCMDQKRYPTASKDHHADFLSLFRQFLLFSQFSHRTVRKSIRRQYQNDGVLPQITSVTPLLPHQTRFRLYLKFQVLLSLHIYYYS